MESRYERVSRKMREYWSKPENRKKASLRQIGENNSNWKGDQVKLEALHVWVRSRLAAPELCQRCEKVPPIDLANKGTYDRNLDNWEYLCRRCHMNTDGRIEYLKRFSYRLQLQPISCIWCQKTVQPNSRKTKFCSQSFASDTRGVASTK